MPSFSRPTPAAGPWPKRCAIIIGLAAMPALGGCQTFSSDGGMALPAAIAGNELRADVAAHRSEAEAAAAQARVARLLRRPLTAEAAVQIALLHNRGLQAAYDELGIAEAVKVREQQPPAPSLSLTRIAGSVETEVDRQIVTDILALATLPARSEIAATRFHKAQLTAALATLRVGAEARRAYYRAVAARERADLFEQANAAAATTLTLAKRLGETGAMNKLDQAREQVFAADIATRLALAREHASSERERLIRVLGLSGDDLRFALPKALPALPKRAPRLAAVEQAAMNRRVDLQIARADLETMAQSYGLTKATRFINVLEGGYADKITVDKATDDHIRDRGFAVTFEVPIFDFGEARLREAEARYREAVNRLAQKAVAVRSEAREAYARYRASCDIARRYQHDVLPLRKQIADELTLRYSAMQIDVFTLLAEAQQRLAAEAAAVAARRDFYLAQADLSAALAGGEPGAETSAGVALAVPAEAGGH